MKSGYIIASKYRLVQRIGEGAMGEVWAGENQSTGRKVALKFIIRSAAKNNAEELRQRLLREARACGKLSHRNIVQIYDVGETLTGEPFLVLELLRGRTLAERLKDTRRMGPAMAARIGADIASALSVAHAAKIIHRDLKPTNIFLHQDENDPDERFVVKVLDFGVSKILDGSVDGPATVTNMAVGSPVYMSPEQVALQKDLDGRSDIWSLGIVLYEMLTGGRPFSGNVDDVVRQITLTRNNKVPLPSTKVRDVPPDFDALVARCLEHERERRFESASELFKALRSIAKAGVPSRHTGSANRPLPPEVQQAAAEAMFPATALFASPAPAWRTEMAQWRAHRDAAAATRAAMMEAVQAGTQAFDGPAIVGNSSLLERTGTTSDVGPFSHPLVELREVSSVGSAERFRHRSLQTKLALLGLIVFSAIVFAVLAVHATSGPDEPEQGISTPSTSVQAANLQASMVEPEQMVPLELAPTTRTDKPTEITQAASTAAPSTTNIPGPKAAPLNPQQPATKTTTSKPNKTACKASGKGNTCTPQKSNSILGAQIRGH